ncbi:MAG: efflux RND transporter periplasmic adaptor subunit [Phycisphaerales bacterium]|nr:efflux RND transporter periplasmic adaptor subunit [Phycisphaerales bacterium]
MRAIVVVIAIAAIGGGGWYGYKEYYGGEEADQFVVAPLDVGDIIKTVSATGTIEPLVKVIVGSQLSGNIKKWHADFNAKVSEGDVLAEIDPDRFQTAYDQAQANLALAKARDEELLVRYKDAQREHNRLQRLFERNNAASENELLLAKTEEDAARAAWHGAKASVQSAEAALNAAKVDLDRAIIRSPIDGVVIARNIEDGQTVAASLQAPELFVIANDLSRMQVNANVSESDIGLIQEGMPASFRVDAYPNRTFTGTISQIRYNATDVDGVVTYVTLIEVGNDDLALRPGMTANVTFEVAKARNVVRIPNTALRFNPFPASRMMGQRKEKRRPTVYVLDGGKPKAVELDVGLSDGTWTELKGGELREGESVITERNWRSGKGRKDLTRTLRRR